MRPIRLLITVLVALWATLPAAAQEPTPTPSGPSFVDPPEQLTGPYPEDTGIYVTTQDFVNYRTGPGELFDVMRVIDPEVTLMAVGRTADTRWVQVVDTDGVRGWLFVRFLVYSGDVVTLPVDGVNPLPFVRRAGAVGVTTREAILYDRDGFSVNTLPAGTRVELVGRLGSGSWSRYQILINNELFWLGSWDVRVVSGSTLRLFDTAYLYPYGRVITQLDEDIANVLSSLDEIDRRWIRLASGQTASCERLPPRVERGITDFDARQGDLFGPAVVALDNAIAETNTAVAAYADACTRAATQPDAFVNLSDVREAQNAINEARLQINIVQSMYAPLQRRDPLIRILSGQEP